MIDLRLVVPAASVWLACGSVVAVPQAAPTLAIGAWVVSGIAAAVGVIVLLARPADRVNRRKPSGGRIRRALRLGWTGSMLSLVAVALALTALSADLPRRTPDILEAAARQGDRVSLSIRVDSAPRAISSGFGGTDRWLWEGTAVAVSADAVRTPLDTPVTVIVALPVEEARQIALGASVEVAGAVRATEAGSSTSFIVMAGDELRVLDPPPAWLAWTSTLREGLSQAAARSPGDGGALLPGLSIGDVTAVGSSLDEAMKASALSHLTAVSGANCALVTGLVFFGCALLGFGRRVRVVAALIALAGFVVLVTPGASVVRAAAMAVVVLIAVARGRPASGVPVLGLAVLALLIRDPWLSRDYGFALSVLATAGLLVLAGPLARVLARWMPKALAMLIAIPLAAQVACQPVLLMLAPSLPLYGVIANLLAEPAAPIGTTLGLLACLVLPVMPVLGQALVWLAWLPAAWIAAIARWAAQAPATGLPWPDGPVGVALCVGAVVAITVVTMSVARRRPRGAGRRSPVLAFSGACLIAGAGVYAGSLGGGTIARNLAVPDDWQVAACDVGQGDAILVRDGAHVAMIDTGRDATLATSCLERLGIDRVELLVLTHYDADHVGGVAAVSDLAESVIVGETTREADEKTLHVLRAAGVSIVQGSAGMTGDLGALRWRILWPPTPVGGHSALGGNDGSITMEFDGKGIRSVLLGDLGEKSQESLLRLGETGPADVVKVAHHGSADQSERLYRQLGAAVGLVSVGAKNGYGHPTSKALGMLARSGTTIERTDEQGLILVSPGSVPDRMNVWSEHRASADDASPSVQSGDDGGRPYAGSDRGEQWPHEPAARPARARGAPRQPSSRNSPGTRSDPHPWCWSLERRVSSRTGRSARCETVSRRKIRAWRSVTSRRTTTRLGSCSRLRALPCSESRGSSGSRPSRSATTSS
jgi:competence protein ComEC